MLTNVCCPGNGICKPAFLEGEKALGKSRWKSPAPTLRGEPVSIDLCGLSACGYPTQRPWQREHDALFAPLQFLGRRTAPFAQPRDHLLHQFLGRGRAGGDSHGILALEPLALEECCVVDEISRPARALGQL